MEAYQLMTPVFGKGLVYDAPNYGVMMEQLQFVVSGMNTNNFARYAPKFQEETEKFIDSLPKTGKFNAMKVLAEIIIATASRCLLGDEVRELLSPEEFAKLYQDLDAGINPLTLFFPSLTFLPGASARDAAKARVFQVFKKIIDKRRANPDADHDDTLQLLLNGKYKTGEPIPDDHICGILLGGLFAGEHTSSVSSTWTLFNILHNQKDYERVMSEQAQVFENEKSQDLTYENIKKMKFLTMCMKESIRINPPIVMLFRVLQRDKKLDDGKIIPKGNWVFVSPTYTHHLESIYKDAGNFHPERWELEKLEQEKYTFGNLSFGGGRHKCIGENFAQLQVTAILSVMLRKLKMKPVGLLPTINMAGLVIGPHQDACVLEFEKL
jgi:sterol 14-demethylase